MIGISVEELFVSALAWVCVGGWRAFLLVGFVLAFDLVFNRRIPARIHCVLWIMVALRMMLPFSVESSLSMHGGLQRQLQALGFSNESSAGPAYNNFTRETIDLSAPDENGNQYRVTRLVRAANKTEQRDTATESPEATQRKMFQSRNEAHSLSASSVEAGPAPMDSGMIITLAIVGIWFVVASSFIIRDIVGSLRFTARTTASGMHHRPTDRRPNASSL